MTRRENDPEAIEREIEHTRQRIDTTLSELGDRLSPGQLLDHALDYVRGAEAPRRFASNLGRSVQDNPVPVVLVGIGLAWLAFGERQTDRRLALRARSFTAEASDADRSGMLRSASEAAHGAVSAARGAAAALGERAERTRERTREATGRLREGAGRARATLAHVRDEQPLLLGLAGLALGAALGGSLPATAPEDELLGEARDEVLERGARAAREGGEALRERAQHERPQQAADAASPEPH